MRPFFIDISALKAVTRWLLSGMPEADDIKPEYLAEDLTHVTEELQQLRAFREGAYKSARDILAASMAIGAKGGVKQDDETFALARREIDAIAENLQRFHDNYLTESGVLNERLTRRFDPAMVWNEAVNRACEAKKIDREAVFTRYQAMAFEMQQRTTKDALRNA